MVSAATIACESMASRLQQTTIRNKAMLEETDPDARRRKHDEMSASAADPKLARDYLLQSSMITALKRAEALA